LYLELHKSQIKKITKDKLDIIGFLKSNNELVKQ